MKGCAPTASIEQCSAFPAARSGRESRVFKAHLLRTVTSRRPIDERSTHSWRGRTNDSHLTTSTRKPDGGGEAHAAAPTPARVCSPPDVAQGRRRNGRNLINTLALRSQTGSKWEKRQPPPRAFIYSRDSHAAAACTRRPNGACPPRAMLEGRRQECCTDKAWRRASQQSSAESTRTATTTHRTGNSQAGTHMARGAPSGSVTRATARLQCPYPKSRGQRGVRAPKHRRPAGARARGAARTRAQAERCTWRPRRRHPRLLATPSRRRPGGRTQPRPVGERKPVHEGRRVPVSHGSSAMETRPEDGAPESGPRPIHAEERGEGTPAPPSEKRGKVKATPRSIHSLPLLRGGSRHEKLFHTTVPYRRRRRYRIPLGSSVACFLKRISGHTV